MSFRKALIVATLLALTACGDPPSPFEHQTPFSNPLLRPGLRGGLVVAPVATPQHDEVPGDVITDAVVLALRDADIPALTQAESAPVASPARPPQRLARPLLQGTLLEQAGGALRLDWRLVAPDGREITHFASEPRASAADWQSLSPTLRAAIASDVVRGLERYLDDAEGIPPAAAELPKVTIAGVDGLPSASLPSMAPQAMTRALEYHLKEAGLTVGDAVADHGAILMGAIEVKPAQPRGGVQLDNLKVSWTVLRTDGREVGVISQANDVPRAQLQGAWGDLAFLIAEAATPGIVDLLQQMVQADAAAQAQSGKPVTP